MPGLGHVALEQSRKEAADAKAIEVERLGGVEENRDLHSGYRGSRQSGWSDAGRWFLTDPMAWPVERGVLDKFLGDRA